MPLWSPSEIIYSLYMVALFLKQLPTPEGSERKEKRPRKPGELVGVILEAMELNPGFARAESPPWG